MSRMGADAQWSMHTGVNPVPHALYRSGGGPIAPNPHRGPAFCLLSIIIDMASSLSAICRLLCTQLPALFQEGLIYKGSVAPSALRGAVLDPHPHQPPPPILKLSALGHHSPTAATLQKPGQRRGAVIWGPLSHSWACHRGHGDLQFNASMVRNLCVYPCNMIFRLKQWCERISSINDSSCNANQTGLILTTPSLHPQGAQNQFNITNTHYAFNLQFKKYSKTRTKQALFQYPKVPLGA